MSIRPKRPTRAQIARIGSDAANSLFFESQRKEDFGPKVLLKALTSRKPAVAYSADELGVDIRLHETLVSHTRHRLAQYLNWDPKGTDEAWFLKIHGPFGDGKVQLQIEEKRPLKNILLFWHAHWSQSAETHISYSEPLFFYDAQNRCFLRFLDINYTPHSKTLVEADIQEEVDRYLERLSAAGQSSDYPRLTQRLSDSDGLIPTLQYQPSGEIDAAERFQTLFQVRRTKEISHFPQRKWGATKLRKTQWLSGRDEEQRNLILTGNERTCPFITELLSSFSWMYDLAADGVKKNRGRKRTFVDRATTRSTGGGVRGGECFGLVKRLPVGERVATIIEANNGRAVARMARALCEDVDYAEHLAPVLDVRADDVRLAPRFEVLFRVRTRPNEMGAAGLAIDDVQSYFDDDARS